MEKICGNCRFWMLMPSNHYVCTFWIFGIHRDTCSPGYVWHVASNVTKRIRERIDHDYIYPPTPGDFGCNAWAEEWKGPFDYLRGELAFQGEDGQWRVKLEGEDMLKWLNELWHRHASPLED